MESLSNFEPKNVQFMHCGSRKLKFIVEGEPVSQARPRFSSKIGRSYEPVECTRAKEKIKEIASEEMYKTGFKQAHQDMPVILYCWFYRPIARTRTQWWKKAAEKNFLAATPKYKDIDNCVKLVSDALNGVAFHDDAQIVAIHAFSGFAVEPRTEVMVETFFTNYGEIRDKAREILRLEKELAKRNGENNVDNN